MPEHDAGETAREAQRSPAKSYDLTGNFFTIPRNDTSNKGIVSPVELLQTSSLLTSVTDACAICLSPEGHCAKNRRYFDLTAVLLVASGKNIAKLIMHRSCYGRRLQTACDGPGASVP